MFIRFLVSLSHTFSKNESFCQSKNINVFKVRIRVLELELGLELELAEIRFRSNVFSSKVLVDSGFSTNFNESSRSNILLSILH